MCVLPARWTVIVALACVVGCAPTSPVTEASAGLRDDEQGGLIVADAAPPSDTALPDDGGDAGAADAAANLDPDAPQPCAKAQACSKFAPETPYCDLVRGMCVQCIIDFHCGGGLQCEAGRCVKPTCSPGAKSCVNMAILAACPAAGDGWVHTLCPAQAPVCLDGSCWVCEPDATYCGEAPGGGLSNQVWQCSDDGRSSKVAITCAADQHCEGGACVVCTPGSKSCIGEQTATCKPDGSGWAVVNDCAAENLTCLAGLCVDPCSGDFRTNATSYGCTYLLANATDLLQHTAAVFAGNAPLIGSILTADGKVIATTKVAAWGMGLLELSDANGKAIADPQAGAMLRLLLTRRSRVIRLAWSGANARASAASLIADVALGTEYRVVAWPQAAAAATQILVGSTVEGTVSITPTAVLQLESGETLPAGVATKVPIGASGLRLSTVAIGADPTGTRIVCAHNCAVAIQQSDAFAPTTNRCIAGKCLGQGWPCTGDADCPRTCCGDHAQLVARPTSDWSSAYFAVPFPPRGKAKDIWRVVADQDGTQVSLDPPIAAVPMLPAGGFFDFEADTAFVATGTQPFALLHVMAGAFAPEPNNDLCVASGGGNASGVCAEAKAGDGAAQSCATNVDCPNLPQPDDAAIGGPEWMMAISPLEASSSEPARVWAPSGFDAQFVMIVTKSTQTLALDGEPLPATAWSKAAAQSPFWYVYVPVAPGSHSVTTSQGEAFWAGIVGWGGLRSYAVAAVRP